MKHTLCDLQEKIFDLQIQLLEEDIAGGKREETRACVCGESPNSSHLNIRMLKAVTFLPLWRRSQGRQHILCPPKKKKKVQFGKLKSRTVTSKPLLTECSGWTVLEMACHPFCTAGHT